VADHRGGLRCELWQHLGDFDDVDQVGGGGVAVFAGLGVEDVRRARAGVEMDNVAAVMNSLMTAAVEEVKFAGDGGKRFVDQRGRDAGNVIFNRCTIVLEQVERFLVRNPHAAGLQDLECLIHHAVKTVEREE